MGRWLETYGPSIYGTRRGPVAPQPWGATTRTGDTVYVHVLDAAAREVTLPPLGRTIGRATLFGTQTAVAATESAAGVVLTLPAAAPNDIDRVVMLALAATTSARATLR